MKICLEIGRPPVENSLIANPSLSMDTEHPSSTIPIPFFSGQKSSHFGQIIAPLLYRVVHHSRRQELQRSNIKFLIN